MEEDGVTCLYCGLNPVTPDALAGLCISCRYGVVYGWIIPEGSGDETYLYRPRAIPGYPMGTESGEVQYTLFDVWQLFPDSQDWREVVRVREELWQLSDQNSKRFNRPERARQLLKALRELGIESRIDWTSYAVIDNPARCPYSLLIQWMELQLWVHDELLKEDAERIRGIQDRERIYLSADDSENGGGASMGGISHLRQPEIEEGIYRSSDG